MKYTKNNTQNDIENPTRFTPTPICIDSTNYQPSSPSLWFRHYTNAAPFVLPPPILITYLTEISTIF